MATVVPAPAGTGNIAQNFALAGSQFGRGLGQFLAHRQAAQQLARLFPNLDLQGITNPQALAVAAQLGLQQHELAGRAAIARAKPVSPAQQITQKQLDRINLLEEKERQGTITKPEAAELLRSKQLKPPKTTFTPLRIEQTKGHLEAGGETTIFGNVIPFVTRKSAINYARRQLGPNWSQASPEAKEIIDRKWPGKSQETIKVISPSGEKGSIPILDWAEARKQGFKRR